VWTQRTRHSHPPCRRKAPRSFKQGGTYVRRPWEKGALVSRSSACLWCRHASSRDRIPWKEDSTARQDRGGFKEVRPRTRRSRPSGKQRAKQHQVGVYVCTQGGREAGRPEGGMNRCMAVLSVCPSVVDTGDEHGRRSDRQGEEEKGWVR